MIGCLPPPLLRAVPPGPLAKSLDRGTCVTSQISKEYPFFPSSEILTNVQTGATVRRLVLVNCWKAALGCYGAKRLFPVAGGAYSYEHIMDGSIHNAAIHYVLVQCSSDAEHEAGC